MKIRSGKINTYVEPKMPKPKGAFASVTSLVSYAAEYAEEHQDEPAPVYAVVANNNAVLSGQLKVPYPLRLISPINPDEVECYDQVYLKRLQLSKYNLYSIPRDPESRNFLFISEEAANEYVDSLLAENAV